VISSPKSEILLNVLNRLKTKLRGLSPQANYTDRATAAVGEVVPTFLNRLGSLKRRDTVFLRDLIHVT
jgi:hypothetical protein